jgi:hypothetical protein
LLTSGRALGLGLERCGREILSGGEITSVGVDPVVLHRFGRRLGLHELLKRGESGISTIIPTRFEPWGP